MTIPIEVIVRDGTGVVASAEAETPEEAVYAAETLKREARAAWPIQGYCRTLTVEYRVDDRTVRLVTS